MRSSRPQSTPSGSPPLIDFSKRTKVGRDAVRRLRPAEPHAKPGHHFVEDERDVVVGRHFAHALQKARPGLERSLDRLEDDAGQLVVVRCDDRGRGFEVVERCDQYFVTQRAGDAVGVRDRLRKRRRAHRPLIAHHRVVVHAVIRAFELQDLVALAVDAGQTHRKKRRLAAAAVQAQHVGAGHVLEDLLAELHGVLIDDEVRGAAFGNRSERLEHRGMRMPEDVRPRAEQVVDVSVAAHVPDVAALGLPNAEVEVRVEGEAARRGREHPLGVGDERALFVGSLDHAALLSRLSSTRGNRSRYAA